MKVEIENLTTVEDLNSAIVLAENRKGELVYHKTIAEYEMENRGDASDVSNQLVEIGYVIDAATLGLNSSDEKTKAYWERKLGEARKKKTKLELREEAGKPASNNSEIAKIGEFILLIAYYDEYITDLEAKKATL